MVSCLLSFYKGVGAFVRFQSSFFQGPITLKRLGRIVLFGVFFGGGTTVALSEPLKAFYIGHSLSDEIPQMVQSLSEDAEGISFDWRYQSIPGASLEWQWGRMNDQGPDPFIHPFYDQEDGLPAGDFDVLVMVDSVPRHWTEWGIETTYIYTGLFLDYAQTHNPEIQIYLYEPWHCINSGTPSGCDWDIDSNPWRQRLIDDLPMWESAVTYLNTDHEPPPTHPVRLIPAGQGMARLYDAIAAEEVPGIDSIEDLFSDDIHLTNLGRYFIACIHYAVLHDQSPVGLTHQLQNPWGGNYDPAPTPEQAEIFQMLAWQTVKEYRARVAYLDWRTEHFSPAEIEDGSADPEADPFATGIPNWFHFMFGSTPQSTGDVRNPLSLVWEEDGPLLQFQIRREIPVSMWWVESSTILQENSWQRDDLRLPIVTEEYNNDFDTVIIEDADPPAPASFYRLWGQGPFDWE